MVSRTGPAGLALFLLCCVGSLLSYPVPPRDNCEQGRRIKELQVSSKELLQNYDEPGVRESTPYLLPSFNLSCQPPNIINFSNILPYFRAIQPFLNNENVNETIGHLNRLKGGPETEVSVPTEGPLRKRFIFAVLREFSTCMESMSPTKICEDFKKIKMSDS